MPVTENAIPWTELDPAVVPRGSLGFVWGNCQAESIRRMIAPVALEHGVRFVRLPPVFEMSAADVARLHALLPIAGVLVTQPVKDEYRIPGCGSRQLIEKLADSGQVVTVPSTHYEGLHPWQVHAHDEAGGSVDAPLVDYHDLRLLTAADRGWDVARAVELVAASDPDPAAVQELSAASITELRRRTAGLDVDTVDAVIAAGASAMWTVNHPSNAVLGALGRGVLSVLGWSGEPAVPEYEMLGRIRTPVAPAVREALHLPTAAAAQSWQIDDEPVAWEIVAEPVLELYRQRPDLVGRTLGRYRDRLAALER
ncbi:WcbI family polysaccharide biosynthesis putative acetyltransferase [Nakamurella sp. A5-74]|uniref:WcbI family polysaccharide biosynthesis putative acetyltransferase n=1 Tax=Nakamurella sp. A5-74 TaxID=3158264 RepID=A0AAU8DQL0_9ACTN